VPSVVGLTRDAAITRITAGHLKAKVQSVYDETIAAGNVVVNKPAAGTAAFESAVLIEVSRGPKPRTIPALANESWSDASSALTALRLVPHEILRFSSTVPNGEVISTNPLAGTTGITVGHRVGVTVSKGPQQVAIPIVAGETIAQAVAALQAVGLVVTEQVGPPFATSATTTQPAPGTQVPPGSDVILYVA
jgi:serine/threonine-protein kinase